MNDSSEPTNAVSNEPTNDNAVMEPKEQIKVETPKEIIKAVIVEQKKSPYMKEYNKNGKYYY